MLLDNGNGTFAAQVDYPRGPHRGPRRSPGSVTSIGDGKPDLAIGIDPRAFVAILLNMGGGRFHGWYFHGTTRDGGSGPEQSQ